MNRTDFEHPRDSYPARLREFYAAINGADAAETPRETEGANWYCYSQVSRGPVLEKAGYSLMHIVDGEIYGKPGSIKLFETLAYPVNPRVPGLIVLLNTNETEGAGRSVVVCIDLVVQTGAPHAEAQALFADALRPAYEGAGGNFAARYKAEPGRILAGIAAECGIMDFFQASDEPPLDALFDATLSAYRDVLAMTGDDQPTAADFQATNRHRARLVEWLMLEDIGIQFARKSGVPMSVIEAYGFPPQVRY